MGKQSTRGDYPKNTKKDNEANKQPVIEHIKEDLRKIDKDFLGEWGAGDWDVIWENALHMHDNIHFDSNQSAWHISRVSFLAGFLSRSNMKSWEIEDILRKHLERCKK